MTQFAVKTAIGPTILLQSGEYFDFLDPWNSSFTIEDIAHGLAQCCRFAGQCRPFYSVAEHSLFVMSLVPPEHRFAALMHDAAEAFLGDVTRPLKSLLPEYKRIESNVEAAIFARFGIDMAASKDVVKRADLQALAAEQRLLMPRHNDEWPELAGLTVPWMSPSLLTIEEAEGSFLHAWAELQVGVGA